jgi:Uma2 family endonuclease
MDVKTGVSVEEYFEQLATSEVKLEYRDGEIVAMSGAQPAHNQIMSNMIAEIVFCLKSQNCIVLSSDQLIRVEACDRYTFPDLVIVCQTPRYEKSKRGLDALLNPTIIVEVLSDSTEAYDRGDKYECYQTLESLEEYVLVSSRKKKVEVFSRNTPFEWIQRIYNEENSKIRIGACEIDLSEVYRKVTFEVS